MRRSGTGGWPRGTGTIITLGMVTALMLAGCGGGGGATPTPVPTTGIAGLASAMGGSALDEYVIITLSPSGGTTPFAASMTGAYAADVPAGSYTLSAVRPGYADFTSPMLTVVDGALLTFNFDMAPLAAGTYIGTQACGTCHATQMANHLQSGHPYKMNKVEGGVAPTYPFTDLRGRSDADRRRRPGHHGRPRGPGRGHRQHAGHPDVLERHHLRDRRLRLEGALHATRDGFIVTGTEVQYNLVDRRNAASHDLAYHNNEDDKPFNCGNCHTTGWQHFDDDGQPRAPGRPGGHGRHVRRAAASTARPATAPAATHAQTETGRRTSPRSPTRARPRTSLRTAARLRRARSPAASATRVTASGTTRRS